jgi:hypothetical protein
MSNTKRSPGAFATTPRRDDGGNGPRMALDFLQAEQSASVLAWPRAKCITRGSKSAARASAETDLKERSSWRHLSRAADASAVRVGEEEVEGEQAGTAEEVEDVEEEEVRATEEAERADDEEVVKLVAAATEGESEGEGAGTGEDDECMSEQN